MRPLIAVKAKHQTPSASFLQQALFQRVASVSGSVAADSQHKAYSKRPLEPPAHAMMNRGEFAHFMHYLGMPEFAEPQLDALFASYHTNARDGSSASASSSSAFASSSASSDPASVAELAARPLNTMEFCRQLAAAEVPDRPWKVWAEDAKSAAALADLEAQGRHREAAQLRPRLAVGLATATDAAKIAAHRPRGRAQLPPSAGHVHHGPAASDAEFKVDEVLEEFRFKLEQVRACVRVCWRVLLCIACDACIALVAQHWVIIDQFMASLTLKFHSNSSCNPFPTHALFAFLNPCFFPAPRLSLFSHHPPR